MIVLGKWKHFKVGWTLKISVAPKMWRKTLTRSSIIGSLLELAANEKILCSSCSILSESACYQLVICLESVGVSRVPTAAIVKKSGQESHIKLQARETGIVEITICMV